MNAQLRQSFVQPLSDRGEHSQYVPKQVYLSDGRVLLVDEERRFDGVAIYFEQPHHKEESRWTYTRLWARLLLPEGVSESNIISQAEHFKIFGWRQTVNLVGSLRP